MMISSLLLNLNTFAQSISKVSEIYDFQIGDIFHYELTASAPSTGSHVYTNFEVLVSYYSTSQDTIFYIFSQSQYESHLYAPAWAFTKKIDTIYYTQLDSLVNSGNIDTVYYDSLYFGRKVNMYSTMGPNSVSANNFIDGCGNTYYRHIQLSPNTDWEQKLIYYKKGNEVWGNPIPLSINSDKMQLERVTLFPNPSNDIFNLKLPKEVAEFKLQVYSSSGHLILQSHNNPIINLSDQASGVYFMTLITKEAAKTYKLILNK